MLHTPSPESSPDFRPSVQGLAIAMRDQHAEGVCTEMSLEGAGFSLNFQRAHAGEAICIANDLSARQDAPNPKETDDMLVARMRVAIGEMLPSLQTVVARLQSAGFTKHQIKRCLLRALNLSGRDFGAIGAGLVS